ncbi:MAG: lysophospholipid acyltransferase family protein [Crocinitomicaceae bacterium]|nr:lysophospholipid acyltransferase family protein [Crocinitomicaceae bacterium]
MEERETKKLIPKEVLANAARIPKDNPIIPLLARVSGIEKVNDLYDAICREEGLSAIDRLFQTLDLHLEFDKTDLEHIPATGPFIIVANHPFGALDGLALIKTIAQVRPDFKVMANFLLQNVEPIKNYFLAVNPFESRKSAFSNIAGLKAAIAHLEKGFPLGIFPAGEVSTFQGDLRTIADRKWQNSALKIIRNAKVPIIPICFDGANSYIFHLIGLIHPDLRTLRLPAEIFKKKGKTIRLRIGKTIQPRDTESFVDIEQYGRYLRAKTYAIGTNFEVKRDYFRLFRFPTREDEIIPPVDSSIIQQEIDSIAPFRTLSHDPFECYVVSSGAIPNILREIGRLREITFRQVGEGTNKNIDLDEYDIYYNHLILWDKQAKKIAGAYRIGNGLQIMSRYGIRGFYTSSLFKMSYRLKPILNKSLELGRSFIVAEYQKHHLSLFLLWKGILFYLMANPQFRYIIGPVSISNSYQEVSKELIIQFIQKNYFDHHLARFVQPRNQFKPKIKNVDTDVLVDSSQSDLKKMDRIIAEIEPSSFTMPVLLKKYLKQNAKILAFNADPKFNNALDGLMLLDLKNLPANTVDTLKREMTG